MLKDYKNIYFLGIGGVGMSGLAGWCHANQYNVSGYDRDDNYFTSKLKQNGLYIQHDVSTKRFSKDFLNNTKTLVVYTPAIKKDHNLYKFFNDLNFTLIKRADLLSQISSKYKVIAIAGTHGKTTISIMLSHLLKSAGYNPSAFFGGISINYDTNFLIGDSEYMIVEADEYDQSFLKLNPTISVVTSLDKDHVDTYNSEHDMIEAYCQLYFNTAISNIDCRNKFYISKNAVDKFQNHLENRINLGYQEKKYVDLELNTIHFQETNKCFDVKNMCEHNINNAIIASQIAKSIGLNNTQIKKGFDNYRGVQRRFE